MTLAELAARLDPARFRQVHRSHIVNLDAVEHMRPYDDRRLAITLQDGTRRRGEPRGVGGAPEAGALRVRRSDPENFRPRLT